MNVKLILLETGLKMIETIQQDHRNIMQLLQVLDNKISLLKEDKEIDYRLIKSIISYLKDYADKYHHPMEDLIYDYYLKYRVVTDQVANRLADDHHKLKVMTSELDDLLGMILLDAIISKELFIEKLEQFVSRQKLHLVYEENEILPAIKNSLTAHDWAHLNLQWKHKQYADPLFGKSISQEFESLAERIAQL